MVLLSEGAEVLILLLGQTVLLVARVTRSFSQNLLLFLALGLAALQLNPLQTFLFLDELPVVLQFGQVPFLLVALLGSETVA